MQVSDPLTKPFLHIAHGRSYHMIGLDAYSTKSDSGRGECCSIAIFTVVVNGCSFKIQDLILTLSSSS